MFRKLALFSLLLAFCVTVLGAYLRITDASLGCPDWPGCFGQMIVDDQAPTAALAAEHRGWLATGHHWLAGGLGVFLLGLFGLAFRVAERRVATVLLALAALVLAGAQAALGLLGGELLRAPPVIFGHLLAGLLTLAALYWLSLLQSPAAAERPAVGGGTRWLARLALLALLLQIALGGWTSIYQAGLACQDFPTCLGSYEPPVDYLQALNLPLAGLEAAKPGVAVKAAIHWVHRIGAAVTFVLLTLLALGLTSNPRAPRLSKWALLLNVLLLVQIALGIATVLLRLPVAIVAAHNAVAALLLLNVLHFVYFLRAPLAVPVPARRREGAAPRELPEIPAERLPPIVVPPPAVEVDIEAEPIPAPPPRRVAPPPSENLFGRLKTGLGKTRGGLTGFLANLTLGKKAIDGDLLEEIEAQLLMADIGVAATAGIIKDLTDSLERSQLSDMDALTTRLREHLYELIEPVSLPLVIPEDQRPFVILVVGVNGVGKTTTIGKLANRLKMQGYSVMLAAGDTFRAAAVEQLQTWGERNEIHVIAQGSGADSASVIFDGVKAAQARGIDVLIADTAGRLHTKSNLMEELSKIKRIMRKLDDTAPHEVLLVLDGGTGQNALSQAKQFNEAVGLTGLAVTKLDGTAKGGVVFALAKQFGIPIRYIGVGESIEDLQDFDARKFIDALFTD